LLIFHGLCHTVQRRLFVIGRAGDSRVLNNRLRLRRKRRLLHGVVGKAGEARGVGSQGFGSQGLGSQGSHKRDHVLMGVRGSLSSRPVLG
jgi:hypothetical protein